MFHFFYYGLLGVSALLIYSWVSLFFLPKDARDARWSNKRNTGAVTVVFCAVTGLIWYFQNIGNQRVASLILYRNGCLVLMLLWAIRKGRWN